MHTHVYRYAIAICLVGLLVGGYLLYRAESSGSFDERLQTAIQAVQGLRSYEMTVDTATVVSARAMRISGLYRLDYEGKRYGSFATTTLFTPELSKHEQSHTFSLQNLAVGDSVYVKIETDSPLLKKTIPNGPEWHRLPAASIPPQYQNIAVAGPFLDTLAILGNGGAYLTLTGKPTDLSVGTTTYHSYRFRVSKEGQLVEGGTLRSLVQRIATGTVDVLIDDTPSVRGVLVHGDNYESTTTILSVNTPFIIPSPAVEE
jgi:hypothetical protein